MKKTLLAMLFVSLFLLTSLSLYAETYGEQSTERLKSLAIVGETMAMTVLGGRYSNDQGVKQNDVEAGFWYRTADEQNNANVQCNDIGQPLLRAISRQKTNYNF